MLEEPGLLCIRNASIMVEGSERVIVLCMKNTLSKSHTALFEDVIFSHYFN